MTQLGLLGLCECGCGELTRLAPYTSPERGWIKGQPVRFIHNHHRRKSAAEYIKDERGCWVWQRAINADGYGTIGMGDRRVVAAHRVYYECVHGPIPQGMQIDHLCRNRACVNPDHLEVVTQAENCRRGANAKLTHEDADVIRASSESQSQIAARYGISQSMVSAIRRGKAWA